MKSQSNKPKFVACVHCDETNREYRITSITIWYGRSRWSSNRLFTVRWRSSEKYAGWYGERVEVEIQGANEITELLAIAAKFLAKHPITLDPGAWLASTGLEPMVFDNRSDEFTPVRRVLGDEYHRYMAKDSGNSCCVAVMATEEFAESALMREFAKHVQDSSASSYYAEGLEFWIANGKKCERDRWTRPEVPDLDRCFSSLGDEHRARVEEEQQRILEQQEAEAEAERLANAVPSVFDAVM